MSDQPTVFARDVIADCGLRNMGGDPVPVVDTILDRLNAAAGGTPWTVIEHQSGELLHYETVTHTPPSYEIERLPGADIGIAVEGGQEGDDSLRYLVWYRGLTTGPDATFTFHADGQIESKADVLAVLDAVRAHVAAQ